MTVSADETTEAGQLAPVHTGGMVALVPAEQDAAALAVEGGVPTDELHLTLAYLGDDVTGWDPGIAAAVHDVARHMTGGRSGPVGGDQEDHREPGRRGPLTLDVFAHARFNPNGGPDGQEPCMVYLFGGEGDLDTVEGVRGDVCRRVRDAIGEVNFPEQHPRFLPHVTAGYNLPPGALTFTGPVVFDRLRVALADQVTDYPLGGEPVEELTAAVARTTGGSVTAEAREKAREAGHAMPDGGFPIEDGADLDNAIRSVGRAKDPEAARRHIIRQAGRLKLESRIPESWRPDGTVTASAEWSDAITAAATLLVEKVGAADAYRMAPVVFFTPESLAIADQVIEPPFDDGEALTAAAVTDQLPSIDLFNPPVNLPPGTGHYVDHEPLPDGRRRVLGRLAEWDVPHIGFDGVPVYAPRNATGYRWFHTKSAWVQGKDGPEQIRIGHLTFGLGHAPVRGIDPITAAAHYDNSKYRGAKVRMYDDEYGPVYAGVTVAGLDGARLEEFSESDTSGDWRRIMGRMELVAALCVNVGAIPKVGLALAASGEPLALVASAKAWGNPAAVVDVDAIAAAVVTQMEQRSDMRDRLTALLDELDETEDRLCEVLIELYWDGFDVDDVTGDDLTADAMPVSRMPPQLQRSYIAGKVAQRIRWGVPGDLKRCVAQGRMHGMGQKAEGACAMLHRKALGVWPGREHGK